MTDNEKKQIEEMANIVCEMADKPSKCKDCGGRRSGCFTIPKMEKLYAAGYRKQSEGEWKLGITGYTCSICGEQEFTNRFAYCPNCGAKMDGRSDT